MQAVALRQTIMSRFIHRAVPSSISMPPVVYRQYCDRCLDIISATIPDIVCDSAAVFSSEASALGDAARLQR